MSESQIPLNNISQEKGVSNYLTSYSISEYGFDLNKTTILGPYSTKIWIEINKFTFDVCMWLQNRHAACYELQKGRFYHNKIQKCTRIISNLLTVVCKDAEI